MTLDWESPDKHWLSNSHETWTLGDEKCYLRNLGDWGKHTRLSRPALLISYIDTIGLRSEPWVNEAKQAAAILGLSSCQVRLIARQRGLGKLVDDGPVSYWLFSKADVNKMKVRPRPGPVRRDTK